MNLLRVLWYAKWIVPALVQVLILLIMIRRRLFRDFPLFLSYTAFEVVYFACRFPFFFKEDAYAKFFYISWVGKAIEMALGFAVIYEIFRHVFRPYPALAQLGKVLFRWGLVVLVFVVTLATASAPENGIVQGLVVLERGLSIIQCGLLFLLFLFSSYFGLTWRHYVYGIGVGFGFFGTILLATAALHAQLGPSFDDFSNLIEPLAYNCSVLIWISYLLRPEPVQRSINFKPTDGLQEWNHELLRLLNQ
ncbi:MAG TPA: hypothetical protein VFA89_02060 [Terriglobales bacterium]|nr:hypothetical protein [Terriglobales bacterium]